MSILVPTTSDEARAIKDAARQAGLSQRQFCRQAILAAAESSGPMIAMLREIHSAVCNGNGPLSPEAAAAQAALVQLGIPKAQAQTRVAAAAKDDPKAPAEELIRKALTDDTG